MAETTLDGRPDPNVNIIWKAGDTLTIEVAPDEPGGDVGVGMQWDAQVRTTQDAPDPPAATFTITPPAAPGDPAVLVLPATVTRTLAESGTPARFRDSRGTVRDVIRFDGVWDCQTSAAGSDPVRTIAAGSLTIDLDVTRETGS